MTSFFKTVPADSADTGSLWSMPAFLLLAALFYNAGLAIINAFAFPVTQNYVMLAEMMIVVAAFGVIALRIRTLPDIRLPLGYLVFSILIFLYLSIAQEHIYLKSLRDMLLIVVFFMLGGMMNEKNILYVFRISTILILSFILMETFLTDLYVSIFQPAKYYEATRGIELLSVDETGLFRNALGYESRFSFGIFSTHRVSSLFLEQVSFANFMIVLMIYLSAFWNKLPKLDRSLIAITIILGILTNSSRTAMLMAGIILMGHFIFPLLPRYSSLIYMPILLLFSFIFFYDPNFEQSGMADNVVGRVGKTVHFLTTMGNGWFVGGSMGDIVGTGDSGYAYLIFTQTLIGLLGFWLFTTFAQSHQGKSALRFAHGLNIYLFLNLLIGAAVFSIKVSAPLWFVAGYLFYKQYKDKVEAS